MSKEDNVVSISIDLKKDRIRIHRTTLYKLGNPKLIQLLLSPECKVAIKAVDRKVPGGQEIEVNLDKLPPEISFEVYSGLLIERMREAKPELLHDGNVYRLTGTVNKEKKIAMFPTENMLRLDNE